MGEEWRSGWHPESIAAGASGERGAGGRRRPGRAGIARALGQRGYEVHLAEAGASWAAAWPRSAPAGPAAWARVRDRRVRSSSKLANVDDLSRQPA